MAIAKIKINQATLNQLKTFAERSLGMYFDDDITVAAARAQVKQAWGDDPIPVEMPEVEKALDDMSVPPDRQGPVPPRRHEAPPAKDAKSGKPLKSKDMVTIIIDERDEPGGDRPVEVGSNGRLMLIPRGQEVEVPYEYFEVLMLAKQWIYTPKKDAQGNINGVEAKPREQLAYPVRLIHDPRAAERRAKAARRTEEHEKINERMLAAQSRAA